MKLHKVSIKSQFIMQYKMAFQAQYTLEPLKTFLTNEIIQHLVQF